MFFGLLIRLLAIKKNIIANRFTNGKSTLKKLLASFCWYFSREACHITNKNIVCNSIDDYLKIFLKKIYLTKLENN
jgi:hypothetical protein